VATGCAPPLIDIERWLNEAVESPEIPCFQRKRREIGGVQFPCLGAGSWLINRMVAAAAAAAAFPFFIFFVM